MSQELNSYLEQRIIERVKTMDRCTRIALIVSTPTHDFNTIEVETVEVNPLTIAYAFFKVMRLLEEQDANERRQRALDRIRAQPYYTRARRITKEQQEDLKNERY